MMQPLRNVADVDAHVFFFWYLGVEVEVLAVDEHVSCPGGGDGAVDVDLESGYVSRL
jgi:hypothetical protein